MVTACSYRLYVTLYDSLIRDNLSWLGGRVGRSHDALLLQIAHLFGTMCHISIISDMLRQGVNSLAQWLDTPAIRVRIPSGTWDFFFKLRIISYLRIFIFVLKRVLTNEKKIMIKTSSHLKFTLTDAALTPGLDMV